MSHRPNGGFWHRGGLILKELSARGLIRYCCVCSRDRSEGGCPPYCHKGDCSDLFYERWYRSWAVARRGALRRANGRCEACGDRPTPIRDIKGRPWRTWGRLEVDHKVEVARGGDLYDPQNLQVLCSRCHAAKTRKFMRLGRAARHRPDLSLTKPLETFA